jgi:5-methylcytosine-specific restriction endonuclease McrA
MSLILTKNKIASTDSSRCCYCLTTEANSGISMTYDHIRPVSKNLKGGVTKRLDAWNIEEVIGGWVGEPLSRPEQGEYETRKQLF